jgi:ribosomal protein S4
MVRTRSAAAALAGAGFVRLNGKRVTAPGHLVRVGDVVTLALDHGQGDPGRGFFAKNAGTRPPPARFTAI